jgi:hypothetical protein
MNMARLSTFIEAEQLTLDDVLAEFRDEAPPEVVAAVEIGPDPDAAGADQGLTGDVSQAKIGTVSHNGTCPYTQQCEERRRQLPTYREYQPCHWMAWGDWRRCPIYRRNGGTK